ncbi:MAG: alpha/beta fold hydrolase [Ideonella sp.]|nr:alpha/beta fold hydrolase [Ideonella sp.]MCC7458079.1 alpha/beta fold hydrolase [Nitrospira sp.]
MALQLAFEDIGTGSPVVILHGLFGSSGNWRSVARSLSSRHRVLSVDLRNHGSSPWADSMDYLEMAEDVRVLIAREGLPSPSVVGHSMGGKTAMALALASPASVGNMVVVDIAPVPYADRFTPYVEAMRSIGAAATASRTEAQRRLSERLPDPNTAPFLMQNLVSRNDHFDWRLNLAAIGMSVPTLSAFPSALLGRRFTGPATLIHGSNSDYVAAADIEAFRPLFPALEVHTVEAAGHWVHAEQPQAFLAALQQALDRHAA